MRILVVEDSRRMRQALTIGLRKSGFAVDTAEDGEEGLWMAESNAYAVIVLDLMLPKLDGLTVLTRLRDKGRNVHVLILTARDAVEDRVRGLQLGADDYLIKPFAFEELQARIQALVRRAHGVKNPRVAVGDLTMDLAARSVSRGAQPLALTPREYALLELLALHKGELVTRSEIEHHIYDERVEPASNVVEAAIYALRRKIDVEGQPSIVTTRRGMGYLVEVSPKCESSEVSESSSAPATKTDAASGPMV